MFDKLTALASKAKDSLKDIVSDGDASHQHRSAQAQSGQHVPGPHQAGQHKPGQHNPGHQGPRPHHAGPHMPGQHNPGPHNPGQHGPGPHHSGQHKPGPHAPGPHHAGQPAPGQHAGHAKHGGGPGFRVIVDVNQMTCEEGERAHELCSDGVLMIFGNTKGPMPWRKVCKCIHADKPHGIHITEDVHHVGPENREPPQAVNYKRCVKLGIPVDYAFVYNAGAEQWTLTPEECRKLRGLYDNKLLIHLRHWGGKWKENTLASLKVEGVKGACFEMGASVENLEKHNGVGFARDMLAQGTPTFFLIPPTHSTVNYGKEVQECVDYMAAHGVDTSSPLLHIIIAVYERHKKPISGFFDGQNTVLAALRTLQGRKDCCCCLPGADAPHAEL